MKKAPVRLAAFAIASSLLALAIPGSAVRSAFGVKLFSVGNSRGPAPRPGLGSFNATPQIRPPTFRGISALLPVTDMNEHIADPTALLAKADVDGISVRLYWRYFYKDQNDPMSIDFQELDEVFRQAALVQKPVRLGVAPGFYSPAWVLNDVQNKLMLPVPQGPLSVDQNPQNPPLSPLPLPWDPKYLKDWLGFVDQLGAHYGDTNLSWISVAGPNSHNDEVNLPHGDPVSRQVWLNTAMDGCLKTRPTCDEQESLDWLQGQLEAAWFQCIDRFDAAFGQTGGHYTIAIIQYSFPVEGDAAREHHFKNRLVNYGASHYPRSFGIQTNGLNGEPLCTNASTPHSWWHYIQDYSPTLFTGFQTQAPSNLYCQNDSPYSRIEVLRKAIDNAIQRQAHFVEIYGSDILNPQLDGDICYAHRKVGPPLMTLSFANPSPGAGGWYNGPVTGTVTASSLGNVIKSIRCKRATASTFEGLDSLNASATVDVSSEGDPVNVSCAATDEAGYQSEAVHSLMIDTRAPVTTASTRIRNLPGIGSRLEVDLSAVDNLSGVATTEYSLDHGVTWNLGKTLLLCDGNYKVLFRSTDVAGNVEKQRSIIASAPSCGG